MKSGSIGKLVVSMTIICSFVNMSVAEAKKTDTRGGSTSTEAAATRFHNSGIGDRPTTETSTQGERTGISKMRGRLKGTTALTPPAPDAISTATPIATLASQILTSDSSPTALETSFITTLASLAGKAEEGDAQRILRNIVNAGSNPDAVVDPLAQEEVIAACGVK